MFRGACLLMAVAGLVFVSVAKTVLIPYEGYTHSDPRLAAPLSSAGAALMVWNDQRPSGYNRSVHAAWVTDHLTLAPPGDFEVAGGLIYHEYRNPDVASGYGQCLVVWDNHRDQGAPPGPPDEIMGWFVYPTGPGPSGFYVQSGNWAKSLPAVAFEGSQYLVVWLGWREGYARVYGARVLPNGTVLDPTGIPISTVGEAALTPSVASAGGSSLVAWSASGQIKGAFVDDIGTPHPAFPIESGLQSVGGPSVVYGDGLYYVSYVGSEQVFICGSIRPGCGLRGRAMVSRSRHPAWSRRPLLDSACLRGSPCRDSGIDIGQGWPIL